MKFAEIEKLAIEDDIATVIPWYYYRKHIDFPSKLSYTHY